MMKEYKPIHQIMMYWCIGENDVLCVGSKGEKRAQGQLGIGVV